jgi:hypothetical protein
MDMDVASDVGADLIPGWDCSSAGSSNLGPSSARLGLQDCIWSSDLQHLNTNGQVRFQSGQALLQLNLSRRPPARRRARCR